jgi:hypothetical protein
MGLVVVLLAGGAGLGVYELAKHRSNLATASVPLVTPVAPSPTVAPVQNAITASLQCRLPVYVPGQPGSGGFVTFPAGTFSLDPASKVGSDGNWYGLTYDRAVSKWLPVPRAWVNPKGTFYVYADDGGNLVEVNAGSGTTTVIRQGFGAPTRLVDVENAYPPTQC